ncbi:SPOR domain-containing protein [Sphingomonas sp. NSE70-1]|uniref:SPOR domain-containing protein n=1 Tax=Sphingomonas caseinilyticus TaxID=2908205 RepID=A0ABT0RRC2_9SPHN|nr:SPOR domain-containing protein [Sphingomonas caseinilyticus]MCL6697396.1 SPOR domain-containing protein [Sphingomonas caseinilyticus]
MRKLLLGLMIGALAVLPAQAQSVRAGIDAWQKGDTAAAVAIWRPLAEKGDADAAFNLGQAYRLGRGVKLDLSQAQIWLDRAARKGHVDAQTTLGLLLFQNGNQTAAMRWLNGAAEAGEPRALLMVGTALYNGDGVARDPVKAYAYVSRAAAQGLAPAKATLADMDSVMPLEQRQEGVALAQSMVNRTLASESKAPSSSKPPAAKPIPPKVAQAKPPAPPKATPASPPKASAAATGRWRVQLGAFGQRKSAETLYAKLSGKLGGKPAYYVPAGAVVRLQAGPFESRAAASAACARLAPQPCFPVETK